MSLRGPISIAQSVHALGRLPSSPAGRMDFIATLLRGLPIVDAFGHPTGEYTAPFITKAQAAKLMEGCDAAAQGHV